MYCVLPRCWTPPRWRAGPRSTRCGGGLGYTGCRRCGGSASPARHTATRTRGLLTELQRQVVLIEPVLVPRPRCNLLADLTGVFAEDLAALLPARNEPQQPGEHEHHLGALEDSLILVTFSMFCSIQEPMRPSMVSSQATMQPLLSGAMAWTPGTSPRKRAASGRSSPAPPHT